MKIYYSFGAALLTLSGPAIAEVKSVADNGFSVVHIADVDASPMVIWSRLISPKEYWNKTHSWSGSVDGFYLDPKAGGCFCENMLTTDAKGKSKVAGTVEHMRVIFADPGKVLRMQGALGPLQSEAVLGTMTVAIVPSKSGTGSTLSISYVVGGFMRYKTPEISAAVDKVIGEQFNSLVNPFIKIVAEPAISVNEDANDPLVDKVDTKQGEWSLDLDDLAKEGASEPAVKPAPKAAQKVTAKPKPKTTAAAKSAPKPPLKLTPKTTPKTAPKPSVKAKPKVVTPTRKDPEVR